MYIKANLSVVQLIENGWQNHELTYCFHRVGSNVRRQHEQHLASPKILSLMTCVPVSRHYFSKIKV